MVEPKSRFRIHLSTAMVMMVVAGVLVNANIRPRTDGESLFFEVAKAANEINPYHENEGPKAYGWPLESCVSIIDLSRPKFHYFRREIVANAFIALAILALTAFLSESLIRRRCRSLQEAAA